MPRQVSESSLESFGELLREFDGAHPGTLDLAEFEGFTFHLLEHERYEELNLEFKFNPATASSAPLSTLAEIDQSAQTLLQELEQGTFGTPETNYYYPSFTDGGNISSVSV